MQLWLRAAARQQMPCPQRGVNGSHSSSRIISRARRQSQHSSSRLPARACAAFAGWPSPQLGRALSEAPRPEAPRRARGAPPAADRSDRERLRGRRRGDGAIAGTAFRSIVATREASHSGPRTEASCGRDGRWECQAAAPQARGAHAEGRSKATSASDSSNSSPPFSSSPSSSSSSSSPSSPSSPSSSSSLLLLLLHRLLRRRLLLKPVYPIAIQLLRIMTVHARQSSRRQPHATLGAAAQELVRGGKHSIGVRHAAAGRLRDDACGHVDRERQEESRIALHAEELIQRGGTCEAILRFWAEQLVARDRVSITAFLRAILHATGAGERGRQIGKRAVRSPTKQREGAGRRLATWLQHRAMRPPRGNAEPAETLRAQNKPRPRLRLKRHRRTT